MRCLAESIVHDPDRAGGRHYRGNFIDQNFDTYSTEFSYADGAKLFLEGRCVTGTHSEFASYAHGTKGSAIISESIVSLSMGVKRLEPGSLRSRVPARPAA